MNAYRIANWWKFEMLKNGKLATARTKMGALRIKPLAYVRFPVHGHSLSADYRRMVRMAGPEMAAACDGVYKMLVGLAGNQVREYRGWILDDRQRPLDPEKVAELLCLSAKKINQVFKILTDKEVNWVILAEFPANLSKNRQKSLGGSGLASGRSQIKKSGNFREEKGVSSYGTEDETVTVNGSLNTYRNESVSKPKGKVESREPGEQMSQPHPQPQAPVSDSATDPDSVSTETPVSGPVSVSVSDSRPGAADGAEGSAPLTDNEKIFEIIRESKKAALQLSQIIHPRTTSDVTTINDIFMQLQQRLIAGSPHQLFELSLNTARQCWRADKPIAMFVAAMKKPPFYYVPKKLSVVPGKYARMKNNR